MHIAASSPTAILFCAHFVDDVILAQYRKLKREAPPGHEVILLHNITDHPPAVVPADVSMFCFDQDDLNKISYPVKKTRISSYNVEMFLINFWLRNPHYAHYWMIEYDMRFSGNWQTLFGTFAASQADLLSTTLFRYPVFPLWRNWPSLKPPKGITLAPHDMISSYMPFFRISNRALTAVHEGYLAGWGGHSECTMPTIIGLAGLDIEDIGGTGEFVRPENRGRFYRNTPASHDKSPGTLVFRPVRQDMGDEPDMLWHPIKVQAGMPSGLGQTILRRARLMLKDGIHAFGVSNAYGEAPSFGGKKSRQS